MSEERARLRSLLGASTELWAGSGVRVEADRWLALSGAPAVDYNVALCHGADTVAPSRDEILEAGQPGLLMLTGAALAEAQTLIESGWVCVGAVPLMSRQLAEGAGAGAADGEFRRLDSAGRDAARALVAEVFEVGPELAEVALPEATLAVPGRALWGGFDPQGELLACLATVIVEDTVFIWSLATAPEARRRGVGSGLVEAALAGAAADGARRAALQAAAAARPFYAELGFVELERWQLWSRPRWVLSLA